MVHVLYWNEIQPCAIGAVYLTKKENMCILANRQHVVITEVQGSLCVPQEMGSDFSLTAGDGSSVR